MMFLGVKRQIINSPQLGVCISVMLHHNSFRVDTVHDGIGIEDSMDCAFFWRNGQFSIDTCMNCQTKCCLKCSHAAAPWKGFITGVGLCCEQVEDTRLDDWRYKMFGYTSRPFVD